MFTFSFDEINKKKNINKQENCWGTRFRWLCITGFSDYESHWFKTIIKFEVKPRWTFWRWLWTKDWIPGLVRAQKGTWNQTGDKTQKRLHLVHDRDIDETSCSERNINWTCKYQKHSTPRLIVRERSNIKRGRWSCFGPNLECKKGS